MTPLVRNTNGWHLFISLSESPEYATLSKKKKKFNRIYSTIISLFYHTSQQNKYFSLTTHSHILILSFSFPCSSWFQENNIKLRVSWLILLCESNCFKCRINFSLILFSLINTDFLTIWDMKYLGSIYNLRSLALLSKTFSYIPCGILKTTSPIH